jgi:mRNA interferase MazF
MVRTRRAPERGSVVYLDFDPQSGHEQAGRRPALILSPHSYKEKVGLALVCPITTKSKNYPFEVVLPLGRKIQGVVLSDQVKSSYWAARNAEVVDRVDAATTAAVLERLSLLLNADKRA